MFSMSDKSVKCNCSTTAGNEEGGSVNAQSNSELQCCLKQRLWSTLNDKSFSDVCFVIGCESETHKIYAHRNILANSSSVFKAMFGKNWSAQSNEVEVPDVEPDIFFSMLRFIYTDDVQFTADSVMKLVYVAKKYGIYSLEKSCSDFLQELLCTKTAFSILMKARLFNLEKLIISCLKFIGDNPEDAFASDSFLAIDKAALCSVLETDKLKMDEVDLFAAVVRWAVAECERKNLSVNVDNQKLVLEGGLSLVRFPLMTPEEFVSVVLPSNLLSKDDCLGVLRYFSDVPEESFKFISTPRSRKECFPANRFAGSTYGSKSSHCECNGQNDGIGFSFDHNVTLVGFGLYAPYDGSQEEFTVDITVKNEDSGDVIHQSSTTLKGDGHSRVFRVTLKKKIKLAKETLYAVIVKNSISRCIYGTGGQTSIRVEDRRRGRKCEVTFCNIDYEGSTDRTNVNEGQIPQILFYW